MFLVLLLLLFTHILINAKKILLCIFLNFTAFSFSTRKLIKISFLNVYIIKCSYISIYHCKGNLITFKMSYCTSV